MEAIPRPTDSPSVRALIERLYAAFDEPNDLETNPRAAPGREAIVAKAVAHGRRDLPSDVVDWFVWSLITTIGTPQTLRHYLPGIVAELLHVPDDNDWWMFIEKMEMAGFAGWPSERRRLVLAAIRLWLADAIMCKERVTAADLPELAPEAVIAATPAALLLALFDPHRGTRTASEGVTHDYPRQVAFILDAERALAEERA